ncbi:hypothetical protein [Sphingobacterium hotanense]|uniref:hypothetical protein n=1 Tax=Sphingobacterium hotanense TaxID=649196 RepID=UPI0011F22A3D|nr:hypothetical protein [Sphingobacterium hotanense]
MKREMFNMRPIAFIMFILMSAQAFAQEKGLDINVDIDKGDGGAFYTKPWVWVIGAAVFILLLVAILRGGKK